MFASFVHIELAVDLTRTTGGICGLNLNLALQCALLHDVIEDTETSFDEVSIIFGGALPKVFWH